MEQIVSSAIKKDGVVYTGRRHHNIIQDNIPIVFKGDNCTQGFVTDTGRFLNRYEAAELVNVNGQELTEGIEKPVYMLMSEDLWQDERFVLLGGQMEILPNSLHNMDCLEGMKFIPDKSIDMILCDLPYGTTACKWDTIIPFEPLWEQYNRIIKNNGAIVLFGNEPFTSMLICSNLKGFKYRWDWNKRIPSGMGYAKYRPMQQTEDIAVFTKNGEKTVYYPQMIKREIPIKSGGNTIQAGVYSGFKCMGEGKEYKKTYEYKNPITLIEFDKIRKGGIHPTQKPTDLLEYLIHTYTAESETVLDNCMGSGTTAIACINTNRNFIGFEMDETYYNLADKRIREHLENRR